jgi:hypothetical protein
MSSDNKNIDFKDYQKALVDAYGGDTSDFYQSLLNELNKNIGIPPSYPMDDITTSSKTNVPWQMVLPSVLTEYPITNKVWWKFEHGSIIRDDRLEYEHIKVPALYRYISAARLLNAECFFAKLEDTRPKRNEQVTLMKNIPVDIEDTKESLKTSCMTVQMGHTYDPWYRSITEHRSSHYKSTRFSEVGFDMNAAIQMNVGSNHEDVILFWGFESTINKTPIYLILYTFATFAYTDRRQKENHMQIIHPYNCSTTEKYDLMNKYPHTINASQYSMPMTPRTSSFDPNTWAD